MGRLDGNVALITGGGTGIGRATSLLLAQEGANVVINYSRSRTDAEQTASEAKSFGRKAAAICADVQMTLPSDIWSLKLTRVLGGLTFW
jgi:3-oxoacyl-[acyl-carrier protein] reductase